MMAYNVLSVLGIFILIGLAWLMSENRKRVNWRLVFWGLGLQLVFAVIILKTRAGFLFFDLARRAFDAVIGFSDKGAEFVFGKLVNDYGIGAIIAFKVLPLIIFVSSLSSILYYLGVIQFIVGVMAKTMQKTMKCSGAESLSAALQVFMGIEASTAIRTYIQNMTRSELFTVMVSFMGTIASSVMVAYASFGADPGHLLSASIMCAPASIVMAKLMVPETEIPETLGNVQFKTEKTDKNIIDAAANGASIGLQFALQVAAMLIAFVSLVWLFNALFGLVHLSFDGIAGVLFSPLAFILGVPWNEALAVGKLLGTKTVFNEFIAYLQLKELIQAGALSPRSITIATYALCGFANFGSMAIMIGGMGSLAPQKKDTIAALGLKSILAGTFTNLITAAIAGILV
jgi:concentrative nucleoside transporter, CNT family